MKYLQHIFMVVILIIVLGSTYAIGYLIADLFHISPAWFIGVVFVYLFLRFYPQIRQLFL